MRSGFILLALIAILSVIFTLAQGSKLDMFDRRDQLLSANEYTFTNESTGNSTVSLETIAEYQTAFWTSVIMTLTMIGAVWFVSKIDYSADTMLYASELNKE